MAGNARDSRAQACRCGSKIDRVPCTCLCWIFLRNMVSYLHYRAVWLFKRGQGRICDYWVGRTRTLNLTACVPEVGSVEGSHTTLKRADVSASSSRPKRRTFGAGSPAEGLGADPGGAPTLMPLTWIGSSNLICTLRRRARGRTKRATEHPREKRSCKCRPLSRSAYACTYQGGIKSYEDATRLMYGEGGGDESRVRA